MGKCTWSNLRDHVSLRISFSSNSPNTTEARTSPITEARASPIWNILSQLYFKQTNRYFSGMTMDQLPKTLFKEGTETQVEKVNNTCRTSILKKVEKYVEAEYKELLGDPLFAQVMAIYVYKLKYSGRVIHSFVCKQLLTAKRHELWFHFARRALRFSVQEFLAITGLKYKDDEPDLDFDNWRGDKGLRMVYLCVIAGLVMAKGEKVCIPHKYIKLVMDFDKMRKFLWGLLHSFDALVTSITEARDKAIPDIGSLLGEKLREGVTSMRCRNWKGSAKVSYEDIISIESDFASTGVVFPYISSTGNGNIIVDAGFERDDEMNDERETVQPYAYNSEEDGSKEEEAGETSDCRMEEEIETAHVSPAKKRKNHYQDIGAESRKKRLLCQRSTDKYRDLEEGMKSYIQGMAMDQLPKTLFKEGTETQVEKVMAIYVYKLKRALRFSMQEFLAITGLKFKDDEPDLDIDNWIGDKGFWSKLLRRKGKISLQQIRKVHLKSCNTRSHVDRLRMVYLCVIAGLVMAKDEKVCIPHKYIKLVIDFDKMRKFPWGLHSFDALAIPDIGSLLGEKLREGVTSMRCRNWKGSTKVSCEDIISIESDFASTGVVFPYIYSTGNGNIIVDAGFERDDEMNDERVDLIIDMYRKKYDWSKHVWGYQETVQPYAYSSEEDGSKEEEAG
ncbi:hypothetical protein F2Q68_00031579 [Brassica cretica]|uniref:DUF1985 domain-containing protein n=1 Tax=Brassica cretica TaxID=69181 RepID=A0A8S9GDR3_BRACR|nr:hypothetical protein F2Q68_00031579 [Brassica cretica]